MTMPNGIMRSTAIAALLSVPFATGAFAQTEQTQTGLIAQNEAQADQATQSGDSTSQSTSGAAQATQAGDSTSQSTSGSDQATQSGDGTAQSMSGSEQAGNGQQQDAVVATVGGTEIRGSDLMTVIGALPPELQSQPPQMLVPMALEQLILRELVLEQARSQNLAEDPEVVALVESSSRAAEDDAMVQVWLDRELEGAVTDEAVQSTYDEAVAQGQENLPPVEQVRPQIEQFLRQQAMQDIQTRLRQDADVVFYDPTGRPIEQQTGQQQGQNAQGSGNASTGGSTSGNTATGSNNATGSNSSGSNSSGNNSGTNSTGTNSTGGNNSGSDSSGTTSSGGNNSGSNNSGGNNSGSDSSGSQSGDSGSSDSSGGQSDSN